MRSVDAPILRQNSWIKVGHCKSSRHLLRTSTPHKRTLVSSNSLLRQQSVLCVVPAVGKDKQGFERLSTFGTLYILQCTAWADARQAVETLRIALNAHPASSRPGQRREIMTMSYQYIIKLYPVCTLGIVYRAVELAYCFILTLECMGQYTTLPCMLFGIDTSNGFVSSVSLPLYVLLLGGCPFLTAIPALDYPPSLPPPSLAFHTLSPPSIDANRTFSR